MTDIRMICCRVNVCWPEPESIVSESAVTLCNRPRTACELENWTRNSTTLARGAKSAVSRGRAELCENSLAQTCGIR